MTREAKLNISHHFEHNIWKIHVYETSQLMILEVRDQQKLDVSFTAIDSNGQIVASNIQMEESWWVSVKQIVDNIAIFYIFDADKNPEVKSFVCYDLVEERIVWESPEFDDDKFLKENVSIQNNSIEIPFHYQSGSDYFNTVQVFLQKYNNVSIVKAVDYLERTHEIVISYFIEVNEQLINQLLVIDKEQNILLQKSLGVFDKGLSDNTFFIANNKLIFVKGVNDFFIYDLSK